MACLPGEFLTHLATCFYCHKGVDCIAWYRMHAVAPTWCTICGVDHFTSRDGTIAYGDPATRLIGWRDPHLTGVEAVSVTVGPWWPAGPEGIDWIRGHHAFDSTEVQALLAVRALIRTA